MARMFWPLVLTWHLILALTSKLSFQRPASEASDALGVSMAGLSFPSLILQDTEWHSSTLGRTG